MGIGKELSTYLGGGLRLAGGSGGLYALLSTVEAVERLPEPYRTMGRIGEGILCVVSFYSLGSGVEELCETPEEE